MLLLWHSVLPWHAVMLSQLSSCCCPSSALLLLLSQPVLLLLSSTAPVPAKPPHLAEQARNLGVLHLP